MDTEVAQALARIELALQARVPAADIRQAIEDVLATYNLVAQLNEVYRNQREQMVMLVGLAAQLLNETRAASDAQASDDHEARIVELLVQLRELGRKHVAGLADLERTIEARKS